MAKNIIVIWFFTALLSFASLPAWGAGGEKNTTNPASDLYLGQTPPGNTPQIFKFPVIANSFAAERIAISNDGKNIYYTELDGYTEMDGKPHTQRIKYLSYYEGKWNGPFTLFEGINSPSLSIDGKTMYFEKGLVEAYFSAKTDKGWETPKRFMTQLKVTHYLQATGSGNYYISSKPSNGIGVVDRCKLICNGPDTTVASLGVPLNTAGYNLDYFISRNESFMILPDPSSGLCISYSKADGSWTNPKNLGKAINFGIAAWGPYVTEDNKYLFYTTGTKPDYSDTYIYWVSIGNMIDSLKHTNFSPYQKSKLIDQKGSSGKSFSYTIPDNTFIDDDGNKTLTYSAVDNGNPLPAWLSFNPTTRTFSGTPGEKGSMKIKVTATDPAGDTASTMFKIDILGADSLSDKTGSMNPHIPDSALYFGQTPPGDTPVVFAPGIVSRSDRNNLKIAFSPNRSECLTGVRANTIPSLLYTDYNNGHWSELSTADFIVADQREKEPFFTPDGKKIFFVRFSSIWVSNRTNQGWTTPEMLGSPINEKAEQYHPTTTIDGTLYFCSNRGGVYNIYRSKCENGKYTSVEKLDSVINFHGNGSDGAYDPYIAPDESYLIFTSIRPGGFGKGDQYISFNKEGHWTSPKNLGSKINSDKLEYGSYVSPDSKYYFFARYGNDNRADIYWVRTSFIDSLRSK